MKKIIHSLPLIAASAFALPALAQDYVVTNMTQCYAFGENGWSEDTEDIQLVEGMDVEVRPILTGGTVSKSVTGILNGETQVVDGAVFVDYPGDPNLGTYPETLVHSCINPAGFYDDYNWNGTDRTGGQVSEYHCPGYDVVGHTLEYRYGTKMQTNEGPVYAIQTEARGNEVEDPLGGPSWKFANPTLVLITADSQLGRACERIIASGGAPDANPPQAEPETPQQPEVPQTPEPETPANQTPSDNNGNNTSDNADDNAEAADPNVSNLAAGSFGLTLTGLMLGLFGMRRRR